MSESGINAGGRNAKLPVVSSYHTNFPTMSEFGDAESITMPFTPTFEFPNCAAGSDLPPRMWSWPMSAELAALLEELLRDPTQLIPMGRQARVFAETQSWNGILAGLRSDYQSVLTRTAVQQPALLKKPYRNLITC